MLRDLLFLILCIVFLGIWLIAWAAFHIIAGGVHILLAIAAFFLILHLLRSGRRPA